MSEAFEKPAVCAARRMFCELSEPSIERALRAVVAATRSVTNRRVMLESFIENVMEAAEARLEENEENLRALELRLKAGEDELKNLKLPGPKRVEPRLKSLVAGLTRFPTKMPLPRQMHVEVCLKDDEARLKSIEARIIENEAHADRIYRICLKNTADSPFSHCSSMSELDLSTKPNPNLGDLSLDTCFVHSPSLGISPCRSGLMPTNGEKTNDQEEEEALGM
jgi:hypothetical protein